MKKLSFILCSVVLMTACQGSKKDSDQNTEPATKENNEAQEQAIKSQLTAAVWTLSKIKGEEVKKPAEEQQEVHFMLSEDDKVSGYTGCNQIMGAYELGENSSLKFKDVATTRRSCPEQNNKENEFLEVLSQTSSFKLDDKKLSLLNTQDEIIAVLTYKAPKAKVMDLGQWELKTLKGEPVKFESKENNKLHFKFLEDNKIAGFSGCNTFSGTYSLNKDKGIEFSQMISTLKACPDVEFKEAIFLKVFEHSTSYTIENDQLKLYNDDGKELASFTAL